MLVTQICSAQWVQLGLEDKGIKDIATSFSTIFAISSDSGSVYRSTDNGANWLKIVDSNATDMASQPPISGKIFMVRDSLPFPNGNLSVSSDFGDTWQRLNVVEQLPPLDYPVPRRVFTTPGGYVFCGMDVYFGLDGWYNAFALSTDEGSTWTSPGWDILGGRLFDYNSNFVITSGDWFNTGAHNAGVYLSPNNGLTWMEIGYPVLGATTLKLCSNRNILCGAHGIEGGLWLSIDSCSTWTRVSTIAPQAGLSIESGGILVGTDNLGVFLFSDDGDSLGSFNEGLTNLNVHTIIMGNSGYVYVGTDNGVWRRPLSEITSVEENPMQIPSSYILSQNFPNPFNPSTKIKYSVPQSSQVVIKIFDIVGNEIETLVNEEKPAGSYELTWNAANLPSGVYFYQLRAGSFVETKKMLLLK